MNWAIGVDEVGYCCCGTGLLLMNWAIIVEVVGYCS